jgi:RNA polymerase sigma factor (sigma-70 family)
VAFFLDMEGGSGLQTNQPEPQFPADRSLGILRNFFRLGVRGLQLTRSRAIDRVRFEYRKKRFGKPVDGAVLTTSPQDPEHAYQIPERGRILRNALKTLTLEERRTIETAFFAELTYDEAAKQLNQPIGTVKTPIRSGLGKLRRALAGSL